MKYLNSCVISCLLWRSCNLWSTDFNRQIFVFNKEIWRRKKEQKEQKEKGKCVHEMTHCTCDCAWTQAAGLEVSVTALLVSSLTLEKTKNKKIILKRELMCPFLCLSSRRTFSGFFCSGRPILATRLYCYDNRYYCEFHAGGAICRSSIF